MNIDLFVIIISFSSLIVGIFIGVRFFKFYNKKQNKKIIENAEEVLSGKRDNKIKIDGEEFDATKFRVRDKEDNEILIDLQGGDTNGTIPENSPRAKEIPNQEVETIRENRGSSGETKRNSRIRSIFSRARRFG